MNDWHPAGAPLSGWYSRCHFDDGGRVVNEGAFWYDGATTEPLCEIRGSTQAEIEAAARLHQRTCERCCRWGKADESPAGVAIQHQAFQAIPLSLRDEQ